MDDLGWNLPDFLWLWRIAAWSMGLSVAAYGVLAVTGGGLFYTHRQDQGHRPGWLRPLHLLVGLTLVGLVLLLLAIGVVGTLGHYGSLGHSSHGVAGITMVGLVLLSAGSALQVDRPDRPWARRFHLITNGVMAAGLIWVTLTGWSVVQKYLP